MDILNLPTRTLRNYGTIKQGSVIMEAKEAEVKCSTMSLQVTPSIGSATLSEMTCNATSFAVGELI